MNIRDVYVCEIAAWLDCSLGVHPLLFSTYLRYIHRQEKQQLLYLQIGSKLSTLVNYHYTRL